MTTERAGARAQDATSRPPHDPVARHYAPEDAPDLVARLNTALARAGKESGPLELDELAALDEFHVRGREATRELARAARLDAAQHVLDAGCGLGGPARRIAREFGCRVTGIDLTHAYCRAAALLTARTGLAGRVSVVRANALRLPFADGAFDVAWTQHVAMNIADKPALYAELYRVLRPGGVLALYDVLAGAGEGPRFPVPWARSAAASFLVAPEALRRRLEAARFTIEHWADATEAARAWFARQAERARDAAPPMLGLALVLGAQWGEMIGNLRRNLDERRVVLVQAVARR